MSLHPIFFIGKLLRDNFFLILIKKKKGKPMRKTPRLFSLFVLHLLANYYRLNACVPPKFTCHIPNPQGDGSRRCGLWEVTGSRGWIWCPYKRGPRELPHPHLPFKDSGKGISAIYARGGGSSSDTESASVLILDFLVSRTARSNLLLKPPSLWYFLNQP